jgi:serine/threonine protein phosphatase PrpC
VRYAIEVIGATGGGQDRVRVVEVEQGLVIALADGAGGTSHGANAAQRIVDVIANERSLPTMERCAQWIEELDSELAGQATAVILAVGSHITGASVGDSGAWLIGDGVIDLTHAQRRKPSSATAVRW